MNKKYKIGLFTVSILVLVGVIVNFMMPRPEPLTAAEGNSLSDVVPLNNEENVVDIAFNYLDPSTQNLIQKDLTTVTLLEANDYESFYSVDTNWETFFIQGKKIYFVEFFKDQMSEPNNVAVVIDFETLEILGMPLVE